MTNPNNSPLATRIVAGFSLAALATYIPIAAFAVIFMDIEYLWGGGTYPPQPGNEAAGLGAVLVLFFAGPLCSLVAGIVGAFLGGYRFHLRWIFFGILVSVSLAVTTIWLLIFARVLNL